MASKLLGFAWARATACLAIIPGIKVSASVRRAAEPIKIGFSVQLTGPLAPSGKTNLLAQQI